MKEKVEKKGHQSHSRVKMQRRQKKKKQIIK